jgi:hypothetical protein
VGRVEAARLPALLLALIHPSTWKRISANFSCTEFSEVRTGLREVASWFRWKGTAHRLRDVVGFRERRLRYVCPSEHL